MSAKERATLERFRSGSNYDRLRLSMSQLNELGGLLEIVELKPGSVLVGAGEGGNCVFVVFEGSLKSQAISARENGRGIALNRYRSGDIICNLGGILGFGAVGDLVALTHSKIGKIVVSDDLHEIFCLPHLSIHLIYQLTGRVSETELLVADLVLHDVTTRVLHALHRMARPIGGKAEQAIVLERPTHEELAEQVGSSREVVTRALNLLQKSGEIECSGREVVIKSIKSARYEAKLG